MLHALLQATTRRIGFNVTYCAGHVVSIRDGGAYGMAVQGPLPPGMRADPPATHASLGPGELAAAHEASAPLDGMQPSIAIIWTATAPPPTAHACLWTCAPGMKCGVMSMMCDEQTSTRCRALFALWRREQEKMMGLSESIMDGADLDKFSEVSKARAGRNVPKHIEGSVGADAAATSLASRLLEKGR